jgi:large subunit ribosomal protein L22
VNFVEARAIARYIWIPPRKLRQVADLIRGKSVVEAMAILRFMPGKAAVPIAKALNSAAANAEHNQDLDRDDLYIKTVSWTRGLLLSATVRGRVAVQI